ncbi:glycosyltransferase family 2 protein [Paucihalobacter ruber]|uniref:Glycosyltransferase family 2 protein n=1 Tax=Paucihalobacter ruber TaxID=2567861 RepID=A0A506PID3_9FLAO|nr:glycosyltransferase family 2 protein [Paucihalobacter ruber]TPV33369.1 glycosyltransferase family 2 protein [Paucihalobacter ruber]
MNFIDYLPTLKNENITKNFKYKFTVFTPVYNRESTIHRVFNSLNKQTFKDFELILINDGSTDSSHEVILELLKTASFKVNYINNSENQHKMACYFQAIDLAQGKFLIILDSDDECVENALNIFNETYNSIPKNKREIISGITSLCMDVSGQLIGEKFPEHHYYSNTFRKNIYFPNSGERWGFTKTEILKRIKINPNMFSRGLIPEGLIWEFISSQGYETLYINEILRIYHTDTSNRLSNINHKKNSFGVAVYSISVINWFSGDYIFKKPKYFLKRTYTLLRAANYLNYKKQDYLRAIPNKGLKKIFEIGWHFKHLF